MGTYHIDKTRIVLPPSWKQHFESTASAPLLVSSSPATPTLDTDDPLPPLVEPSSKIFFQTAPCRVARTLQQLPDESRRFSAQVTIPIDLPPSFRGTGVRYAYYLLVGIKSDSVRTLKQRLQIRNPCAGTICC